MKAISVLQPWATLIGIGAKRIETRSWSTAYRGRLAIHASKRFTGACKKLCWQQPFTRVLLETMTGRTERSIGDLWALLMMEKLRVGEVIATCDLVEVLPTFEVPGLPSRKMPLIGSQEYAFGNYGPYRFMWFLENVKLLKPVPAKGRLGLWDWNESKSKEQIRPCSLAPVASGKRLEVSK